MDLAQELSRRGIKNVDTSTLARALYSSDASLYRVVPQAVVRAKHVDELPLVHAAARELGVPVTLRGSGTSIAGNAVGPGIVVDTRGLNRIISIDPDAMTAVVEPGVVQAELQRAAAPFGLRFGPDPSTHTRCTIGGMIGNNACGSRALGYGRTVDNVESMTVLFGNGERLDTSSLRSDHPSSDTGRRLIELAEANLAHIRTEFGTFGRQVSGYSLEHLLPEKGRRVDRFLVGTEGTLATVLEATVRLVRDEPGRLMLVLGYPTMVEAADAVPALLEAGPMVACEGIDARIVDLVRSKGSRVPDLPKGGGWLFVETTREHIGALVEAGNALEHRLVEDVAEAATLWKIREDGAGLAGRSLPTPAYSGWEDAAVPPAQLGAWLRDFDSLLAEFGIHGYPYGHFGDGCIHCRIDFPFHPGDPASATVFREFMTACAHKVAEYGGTLSGEHGDGRVRSELLPIMYDATSIGLFEQAKAICDPDDLMNPGNIVRPASITDDLRPVRPRARTHGGLKLAHDDGDLGAAVHRCTGVGKCVAPATSGVMCPSYLATKDEKDSTRGRARVLQEALDGALVRGLADPAVGEALDLCLACKGCSTDCPSGIDMATYKSESLHQAYRGKRRPRSHYTLGRLPQWARLAAPLAVVANVLLKVPVFAALAKWVAGIDQRRSIPAFATTTLKRRARGVEARSARTATDEVDVWIWADSFTDHFFPRSGLAAIAFLESHGLTVRVIQDDACCGLTWITTGQLDTAKQIMERTVRALTPYVASGVPVVGLEPSCTATLRSDSMELVSGAEEVASGVLTFAELVTRLGLPLPDLTGVEVVAQPHCHQSAVLGWAADEALLRRAGATVTKVAGCCGLAGNFGVEQGHYEVSVAVAETHLMPAVRSHPDAVVLADGMSCRVQLDDLADVPTMHLAELFASRV